MNELRACYHIAWTSFRSRLAGHRLLAVVVVASYFALSETATVGFNRDLAANNAALVGAHTAVVSAIAILLFGFFVVRDAIAMDRYDGPGELIAATPVRNRTYIFGKWLGNVLVLSIVLCMMVIVAVFRFQIGGVGRLDIWKLVLPFLLLTFPAVALVSALAILFETIESLRGGWASVVYFFSVLLVFVSGIVDPMGIRPVVSSIQSVPDTQTLNGETLWNGLSLTSTIALRRLLYVAATLVVVGISAVQFNRFDTNVDSGDSEDDSEVETTSPLSTPDGVSIEFSLSSVDTDAGINLPRVLWAEGQLLLGGRRRGWYLGGGLLWLASVSLPLPAVRDSIVPLLWIWPLLVWSKMGIRESRHGTTPFVGSSLYPVGQLLAIWTVGVAVTLLFTSGVGLRILLAGDVIQLFVLVSGAVFVPAFALASGSWTKTSRLFEGSYLLLWYAGAQTKWLDFMGATGQAHVVTPIAFVCCGAILLWSSVISRRYQLRS